LSGTPPDSHGGTDPYLPVRPFPLPSTPPPLFFCPPSPLLYPFPSNHVPTHHPPLTPPLPSLFPGIPSHTSLASSAPVQPRPTSPPLSSTLGPLPLSSPTNPDFSPWPDSAPRCPTPHLTVSWSRRSFPTWPPPPHPRPPCGAPFPPLPASTPSAGFLPPRTLSGGGLQNPWIGSGTPRRGCGSLSRPLFPSHASAPPRVISDPSLPHLWHFPSASGWANVHPSVPWTSSSTAPQPRTYAFNQKNYPPPGKVSSRAHPHSSSCLGVSFYSVTNHPSTPSSHSSHDTYFPSGSTAQWPHLPQTAAPFTPSVEPLPGIYADSAAPSPQLPIGAGGPHCAPPNITSDRTISNPSGRPLSPGPPPQGTTPSNAPCYLPGLNASGQRTSCSSHNPPPIATHPTTPAPSNAAGTDPRPLDRTFLSTKLRNTLWGIAGRLSRAPLPHPISRRQFFATLQLLLHAFFQRRLTGAILLPLHAFLLLLTQLHTICWLLLFLIKYYPFENTPASVSPATALLGLGQRGAYPIPRHIWDSIVPADLPDRLALHSPPPPFQPRPPRPPTTLLLSALLRDGFLHPVPPGHWPDNLSAFLRPKSAEKAAFIADLRGLNLLSPDPLPSFSLPHPRQIASIMARYPPGTLWATALDLQNFFWSLRLPTGTLPLFRVGGAFFDSPPFGWNLSPVLAQRSLEFLVDAFFAASPFHTLHGTSVWTFVYYDDVLLIATSLALISDVTSALVLYIQQHHLLISKKSTLEPTQCLKWVGKVFDFRNRTIGNSRATLLNLLGRAILAAHSPVFPKRIDLLCGHALWALRPIQGAAVLLRSWYMQKWHGPRFLPRPHMAMTIGLLDIAVLACAPWRVPLRVPPPLFTPVLCGDAACINGSYLIALFSPIFGGRLVPAPPWVQSQQVAEFFAFDVATRLATRLGWSSFTYFGDNLGTCWLAVNLRPALSNRPLSILVRNLLNRCLWSRMGVHVVHCPSALQPADPLSRCNPTDSTSVLEAVRSAHRIWTALMQSPVSMKLIGTLGP